MSGAGMGMSRSGYPPPDGHGIQCDTVSKRAVRILLECISVIF